MAASREAIELLEAEVEEMGARVMEMRREGPARFRSILDDYLRKLRPPAAVAELQASFVKAPDRCSPMDMESLQARLSAAMDSLPGLLERVKRCTAELERRKAARIARDNKAHSLVFDALPSHEEFSNDMSAQEIVHLLQEK